MRARTSPLRVCVCYIRSLGVPYSHEYFTRAYIRAQISQEISGLREREIHLIKGAYKARNEREEKAARVCVIARCGGEKRKH